MLHDPGGTLGAKHTLIHRVILVALDIPDRPIAQVYFDAAAAGTHVAGRELGLVGHCRRRVDSFNHRLERVDAHYLSGAGRPERRIGFLIAADNSRTGPEKSGSKQDFFFDPELVDDLTFGRQAGGIAATGHRASGHRVDLLVCKISRHDGDRHTHPDGTLACHVGDQRSRALALCICAEHQHRNAGFFIDQIEQFVPD